MCNIPKPKKSTVRHTRAIQRDRTKRPNGAAPDHLVEQRLTAIVHPATLNQVAHFHDLGLRERTLNLSVMMAFVLSLIWRQIGAVPEATRLLNREGLLWVENVRCRSRPWSSGSAACLRCCSNGSCRRFCR